MWTSGWKAFFVFEFTLSKFQIFMFQNAFASAVKKDFNNGDYISLLTTDDGKIFSNLVEQDSGRQKKNV